MIRLANIIVFAALIANAFSYDDLTIGDLPIAIRRQLKDLLTANLPVVKANCTNTPNPTVDYYLYTRENTDVPIKLNPSNPEEVDPSRKIVLLVHGWLSNSSFSGIKRLKDEYIQRYNLNLITVDWAKSVYNLYEDTFCEVPYVGINIGEFLCTLYEKFQTDLHMVHVIGQGFGAHVVGYAGLRITGRCNQKLGRITGLDPFGLLYRNQPAAQRLDPTDADLVDVIHTDGMQLGYGPTCGSVDFHPNCGYYQPGCPSRTDVNNAMLLTDAFCNTLRSLEYMIESVESEDFVAVSCSRCPSYCSHDIITEVYAIMGENYKPVKPPSYKYLNFWIPTDSTPPYAQGEDPYKLGVDKNIL